MKYFNFTYLLVYILLLFVSCEKKQPFSTIHDTDTIQYQPVFLYDIEIDSFIVAHDEIPANATLATILSGITNERNIVYKIDSASKNVFDFRKIKKGNPYALFFSKDSLQKLQYLVYEVDKLEYVVVDIRSGNPIVSKGKKNIQEVFKTAKGTINQSLWQCMVDNKIDPALSMELSEIYSWTIDFFGLQKGDSFKVAYSELYSDDASVGISKIHYALFVHAGQPYYAIPFEQDSIIDFFDDKGLSLRKAFLKAPLRFSRISSHFSNSRMHPVLKITRPHHGVDYAAPIGTPVYSIGDGTVIKKEYAGGAGHMVKIKHNSIYTTAYLHLSKYGTGIFQGARVRQGQIIGYVGSSGLSTGPHLDFRVYKNGSPINPLKLESPPVAPVKPELMPAFELLRDSIIKKINEI
ncbi:MAG: peptidoglycan DD-metalloendopeptidase family protein [Bacteroidales bacterium]